MDNIIEQHYLGNNYPSADKLYKILKRIIYQYYFKQNINKRNQIAAEMLKIFIHFFSQYKYTLKNDHWRSLYYILLVKRKSCCCCNKNTPTTIKCSFFCNFLSFSLPLSTMIYLNALSNDLYDYDHIRIYRVSLLEQNYYYYWNWSGFGDLQRICFRFGQKSFKKKPTNQTKYNFFRI